jgi:hypothetical protein
MSQLCRHCGREMKNPAIDCQVSESDVRLVEVMIRRGCGCAVELYPMRRVTAEALGQELCILGGGEGLFLRRQEAAA